MRGGNFMIKIEGTGANDVLLGSGADEALEGKGGDDQLTGGGGNDSLVGGTGTDAADYSSAPGAVTVNLNATIPNSSGAAGNDTLSSIEAVIGSAHDDDLTGDNPY